MDGWVDDTWRHKRMDIDVDDAMGGTEYTLYPNEQYVSVDYIMVDG